MLAYADDSMMDSQMTNVDFPSLQLTEPLIGDGILNELACAELLKQFLSLLQWYYAHKAEYGSLSSTQNVVSRILYYTERLMEVFNNPSLYIQLQAAVLLQSKAMPVVKLVMKLSPDALDDNEKLKESKKMCATGIALLECFMLNCLSQKPVCEVNADDEKLLLSLLFKHLEDIPLENPQHMVKLIMIHSILNAIYWRLKWALSIHCIPSEKCITAMKTVASYPIQMLRLLAKSVLCLFSPHLPNEAILLDDIEIQTFLNILQSRPSLYQATTLPACSFMDDLTIASYKNRHSFLKWNAHELLKTLRGKCKDLAVGHFFDKLISLLMSTEEAPTSVKGGSTELQSLDNETEDQDLEFDPVKLTEITYEWFDFFSDLIKHFITYMENVLLISANLNLSMMNSITPILGLIRHMIIDETMNHFLFDLSKTPQFLSVIHRLLDKWPELPDVFPLFGNAFYGILISGSNHSDFCFELGRSGILHLLLSFLNVTGVIGDIIKFGDVGIVIGILVVIFNCAQHQKVIPALEMVSTVNILPVFAQCQIIRVAMLAKFALSFMDFALENSSVLDLTQQEVNYISSQLSEAVVDGSSTHWYTDLELLKVLTNLTQSPYFSKNVIQIFHSRGKNSILSIVAQFLQHSKMAVKNAALKLLLNLYSSFDQPSLKQIHATTVEIALINTLAASEDFDTKQLATCAQLLLDPILKEKPDQVLHCIELCCKFNLYDKCLKLCSIRHFPLSSKFCLSKGKSLFHLYRREQDYLHRHNSTISDQEMNKKRNKCYEKAEECIKHLGSVLDQDCIDPEGSKMLDIVMLDYIRETNKLNNLKRCLLCRKKRNLMKSHIWPRSFLRRYGYSQVQDISSKVFISFNSLKPREKSPGEITYWMLCGECEQIISQNGENKFATEIYEKISAISEYGIKIPYGPWLYSFSIGLVFRTFLYFSCGSTEHYLIFQQCREHLLKLPVKYKTNPACKHDHDAISLESTNSSQQLQESDPTTSSESEVNPIVILANPTKLSINHPRKSMLIGALFDAGSAMISGHYLTTGKRDLSGQQHFLVVRLGNLSVLLPLKTSTDYCPPAESLIKPQGGELFIPGEDNCWDLIPEGLWVAIDDTAKRIEETSLNHYAYQCKVKHWKFQAKELELPVYSKEFADKERSLHESLKEPGGSPESSLVSRFLNISYPSLNFLPDEIKLFQRHEYTNRGYLQLPNSHVILLHSHISLGNEDGFTVFLISKFDGNPSSLRTYVIFIEFIRGVQLAYGAYICVDTENRIHITDPLINMKKFSEHHIRRFEYYSHITEEILPLMLKKKGFKDIRELTQRAEVTNLSHLLMSLGSLDSKCENGCWYCEGCCHHCLQPANVGYSLRTTGGYILKFCKKNPCYKFYSEDLTTIPVIVIPLPLPSELLLQITKVISTNWSENTVVIINLCIAHSLCNVHGLNIGQLYVLTQFRTLNFHAFFDFSISHKFAPMSTLPYMQHKSSIIMHHSALFMLILKFIIEDALSQTSYKTLEGLLDSHHSAMQDLHSQYQTEGSYEDTSEPTEDDVSFLFQGDV